ncbi:hypothetical protein [Fibrobacter sp. UWH4]|uniref:hypothetical protein n=1 Tax=Fibrobacter sp. UWH4 TaxID=1896210 RepID=UPI000911B944|nr:hypothetical protein [Fibrobacter sp. UWH4]SHL05475.1 hypothetical protein SAMN05720762_10471 [Fibrobacter sp. UWH4]
MIDVEELKRTINIRETVKLYFITIGRYHDFLQSYAMEIDKERRNWSWRNDSLHASTAAQHEPIIERICGQWFGFNPNNPMHPMRKFFNEHYR